MRNLNKWGMRNLRKGGIWNLNKRGTRSLRERNQNQERELLCTRPPQPLDHRSPWASSCRPGGDQWSPQTALCSWTAGRPKGSRRKCWTGGRPNAVALAPAVALQEGGDVQSPTPAVHTLSSTRLALAHCRVSTEKLPPACTTALTAWKSLFLVLHAKNSQQTHIRVDQTYFCKNIW